MAKRTIDLTRCLCNYPHTNCQKCAAICPQQAIKHREIDAASCDDCGLCTALCPTGAIVSSVDYDRWLSSVPSLTPQVLMCRQVNPAGPPCLGALNRRLLWALAEKQPLALDTSHCQACKPAVAQWLAAEITACNQALTAAGLPQLKLVRVKPATTPPAPTVKRRSFLQNIFKAATHGAAQIAREQREYQYAFDPVIWLARQNVSPSQLFPGLTISSACSACGLCQNLCPEKALTINHCDHDTVITFQPQKCSGCGLCVHNCPAHALQLLPHFSGQQEFIMPKEP